MFRNYLQVAGGRRWGGSRRFGGASVDRISLRTLDPETKLALLSELGYASDGEFVTTSTGERVLDEFTKDPVRVETMVILPGSTIILDDNEFSLAHYLEKYGELA